MSKTKIEWVRNPDGSQGETWNPIRARNLETGGVGHFCVHVSPGCEHCYAEGFQKRFNNPIRYAAQDAGKVELFLDKKVTVKPLAWRKPRRVFVCSMTDLFYEGVPDEWIGYIFAVMGRAPQHTFQVLTKRPERMQRWLRDYWYTGKILPNIWLGVSVEDQQRADERIPILLDTPAAVRFLSAEPLLGSIDFESYLRCAGCGYTPRDMGIITDHSLCTNPTPILDQIITGGESGPKARPMHPQWARDIRDQCVSAGVPYFHKQNGEFVSVSEVEGPGRHHTFDDGSTVRRVGKTRAGRTLDGRTWEEMPS